MSAGWLVAVIASNALLAGLVLWRILGPFQPTARATRWFTIGLLVSLAALTVSVLVGIAD